MSVLLIPTLFLVFLSSAGLAHAQGIFQNLSFESAVLASPDPDSHIIPFAPAFPGWTAYVAGLPKTNALYNWEYLDTSAVSILDRQSTNLNLVGNTRVIEGNFSAVLQAGVVGFINGTNVFGDTTLSQTGPVPTNAQSLLFKAAFYRPLNGSFEVALGGQTLSLTPLLVRTNYTLFGADIQQWAGQTAALN